VTPARSEAHLDFVRRQSCWFCSRTEEIQAHHHGRHAGGGGMGLKTDDYHTVPLCPAHHQEWHQRARIGAFTTPETQAEMWRGIASMLRSRLLIAEGSTVRLQRRWAVAALSLFQAEPAVERSGLLQQVLGLLPPEVGKLVQRYAEVNLDGCSRCGELAPLNELGHCAWECAA
jgi:hypothetical protein